MNEFIPGKWGMFFHNYGHVQKTQCQLCVFAIASASSPVPWAPQKRRFASRKRNIQEHDEQ